jgi:serine/threonine-protein kinase
MSAPPMAPMQQPLPPSAFPRPAPVPEWSPHPMESTALVRPPPSRTGLYLFVGLAGVCLLSVAYFVFTPKQGTAVVNVTDPKGATVNRVDIFVDGRKVCDTAPCKVDPLLVGAHEIKVLADGFDSATQTVNIEGHKDSTVAFALGGSKAGSGLKVAGSQPGVKLYIDDHEVGPLPQEVHDIGPGDHTMRVAGSDRYQPLEKHVTIDKDQVNDLGTVILKVLRGKATISLGTPGARVYLVSGTDRRELPTLPISVDIDTTKTWSLEASKAGFEEYRQPISFDDGQAEKAFNVTLDARAGGSGPAIAWTPPPQQAPQQAPPQQAQQQPPPPPAAAEGESFLNINSIPPSTCFLDGHSLGSTPRVHVSVKPGSHTVKFINADQGLTKTVTVSVGAGETKAAVAKLN